MYYRTRRFTYAKAICDALLNALKTRPAAALLVTPVIKLYTVGPPPTPGSVIADYTFATFNGYADAVITLAGPVLLGGTDEAMIASMNFIAVAGGAINDSIQGYLLSDAGALFLGGEQFPAPIAIGAVGAFLDLDLILPLPAEFTPTVV